jgi:hypothetical protein
MNHINNPQGPSYIISVATASGGTEFELVGPKAMAKFNRDPDGYAAALFGLSRGDYREWVALRGVPLCGCATKAGRPCAGIAGPQLDSVDWRKAHRRTACGHHESNGAFGGGRERQRGRIVEKCDPCA